MAQNKVEPEPASQAFTVIDGDINSRVLLIGDHARNTIPAKYGTLGLPEEQLTRHIAYDIGVEGVIEHMAEVLSAPAVLSTFSRLLIDPNRGSDDPTLVMRLSDGAVVPGNAHIGTEEINQRIETYYEPYHRAVDAQIDKALEAEQIPLLISIHSFTPVWRNSPRHWQAAILWDKDPRLAVPLLEALRSEENFIVGDNEPYTGFLKWDCMYKHGTARGLPHALVEIRQDLITTKEGQVEWGERLARHIQTIMAQASEDLHKIKQFGSRSDD